MKKLISAVVVGVTAFGLSGGLALASPSIDTTGQGSTNKVITKSKVKCRVHNTNTVGLTNTSTQTAKTGKAKVAKNTTGGDANTGLASNSNDTTVDASVTNNSDVCDPCGCQNVPEVAPALTVSDGGSISNTGQDSLNVIKDVSKVSIKVTNANTVAVNNTSTQDATSGDALVVKNTTGGTAYSGDATNTNSSNLTLTVSNN